MADDHEDDHISDMGCHFTWAELRRTDRMALDQERRALLQKTPDYASLPSNAVSVYASLPSNAVSVYNLLGFIDYSLDDQGKAIERFQDVLATDSYNLNALSCLTLIWRRQGLLKLYRQYAERLQRIVSANDPEVIARAFADRAFAIKQFQQNEKRFTYMPFLLKAVEKSKYVEDGVEKAEWYYEYANCLDRKDVQHIMCKLDLTRTEPVLRDALRSFHKVILLLSFAPPGKSRGATHPYLGRAWAKLGRLLARQAGRSFETIFPLEKSLHGFSVQDCFDKALVLSPDDAEVFGVIGAAYIKMKRHEDALNFLTVSLNHQESQFSHRHRGLLYLQTWQSRQQDHEESIETSSSLSEDICSAGGSLHLLKTSAAAEQERNTTTIGGGETRPSESSEVLDRLQADMQHVDLDGGPNNTEIDIEPAQNNCNEPINEKSSHAPEAHQTADLVGANENVIGNKRQIDRQNFLSDGEHVRSLLLKAKESFSNAIRLKATHADHSDLGYVLYLIGEDLYRCIHHYSIAMRCPEGDDADIAQTRVRWADCLEALGEHQGADIQRNLQRQTKISTQELMSTLEQSWKYTHGVNCQGYECDISRHNYCLTERPGYVNILSEYNTPVSPQIRFLTRCPGDFKFNFFVSFSHIDYKWSIALVQKIEKDFPGVRGRLRYRDYELGAPIADNIVESIENSYRTLIVLTPDSLRDHWCRYEVQRTHMITLTRPCAIPVLLRPCRIPREIEHLSVVKCDRGQLTMEDWKRLGKSLQQSEFRG